MEHAVLWAAAAGLAVALLLLLHRPLGVLRRVALRSGAGLCALWAFNQVGGLIGVRVGMNLVSALVLGILGAPGLGLLLMTQWALR